MDTLKTGISNELSIVVSEKDLATTYGSGGLPVFATPGMIALMEGAACLLAKQEPYNIDTVGTELNIKHLRACKLGAQVTAKATLTQIDGKRLYFEVTAWDKNGEIGNGTHTRYIVDVDRFMSKIED